MLVTSRGTTRLTLKGSMEPLTYVIDWTKITTFDDLKRVLMSLEITYSTAEPLSNSKFSDLSDLLLIKGDSSATIK